MKLDFNGTILRYEPNDSKWTVSNRKSGFKKWFGSIDAALKYLVRTEIGNKDITTLQEAVDNIDKLLSTITLKVNEIYERKQIENVK